MHLETGQLHIKFAAIETACTGPAQDQARPDGEGSRQAAPFPVQEQLAGESCWERESHFFFKGMSSGGLVHLQ